MREFEHAAQQAGFVLDDAQRQAALRLGELGAEVTRRRGLLRRNPAPPRGVYLWGSVGRGKSWLTTTFYEALPLRNKRRLHFHDFFREFHAAYYRHRGDRRVTDLAVTELLGDCRFLVFDEFHVHDAGDAMLIGRVLRSILDQKITLLTTSNYPPAGLLPNPVFHEMFEPTIKMLEETMDVVELGGGRDYRAEYASGAARSEFERGAYVWPGTGEQLAEQGLSLPEAAERRPVEVSGGRTVPALAVRGDLVWFDFHDLCDQPNSTGDYLAVVDRFPRWVLSGLPRLAGENRDAAQRFANLIDVLCDRDVRLVLVGEAPLDDVLRGETLPLDVNRTASRLSLLSATADSDAH
ncbi:cell division protein ZapE [Streptomyces sp. NBC_00091]|uniref:cell division protein ZapE n=1 Tax=Streptomyces sp. NBC_00091 TaxID=2975648 RepID=UPI00224FEF53|nr:cell division protein ZapE [Streptomyces sp. NBC_00091]MCX5380991.1 cell division protein ZapE [Streptomyces sp. NBC_00091]